MKNKFQGSFFLWNAVLHVACLVVLGSIAFFGNKFIINNYKAHCIITESKVIDDALIEYSANHHRVINSSIKFVTNSQGDTILSYNQSPVYPASLDELKKLQSEYITQLTSYIDVLKKGILRR